MSSVPRLVRQTPRPLPAILWAGLLSGALDIGAAFIVYGRFGLRPIPLLQGIAAGLLGTSAFHGGLPTAALGLFCHFSIALSAAAVFLALGRFAPFVLPHWILAGVVYGVAVYFFMNRVVVPLSAARKYPFTLKGMLIGVIIHVFCIGLPIAGVMRQFSKGAIQE